jgi:uridine kinase
MRVTVSTKLNSSQRPLIVGVCGGSGSGKTYFARELCQSLGADHCEIVYQDNFYFDQSKRFDHDGGAVNFDHPDSIDFDTLAKCLGELKSGHVTQIPIYDFVTHSRMPETLEVKPKRVILVDGILIFNAPQVRTQFDEMIFFETSEALRFQRRLDRDVKERGRTPDGVYQQFIKQVKPMHDEFVEPSKVFAGDIIRDQGEYDDALLRYVSKFRAVL